LNPSPKTMLIDTEKLKRVLIERRESLRARHKDLQYAVEGDYFRLTRIGHIDEIGETLCLIIGMELNDNNCDVPGKAI
jgi:hypothetical protein